MVKEACVINKKNSDTLWQDAIQEEMGNVETTFQTIPKGEKPPNGFQYVDCHMVFDIKTEDNCRKACLMAGGHMIQTIDTITYSSLVMRVTVCITLTMAVLHDQIVKALDVINTYVMAPNREKIWRVLGPEFGDDACKSAIIVRAFYSLKSAGASFRSHLTQSMQELRCHFCYADSDLWMNTEYRPEDKMEYYFYILCYVDDILCIHHDPNVLNKLNGCLPLKYGLVGSPDIYLGTNLKHATT